MVHGEGPGTQIDFLDGGLMMGIKVDLARFCRSLNWSASKTREICTSIDLQVLESEN
jgi:hypothetical protein